MRRGDEPVVPRVDDHAVLDGRPAERPGLGEPPVVGEAEVGHLDGPGLENGQPGRQRLPLDAVPQPGPDRFHGGNGALAVPMAVIVATAAAIGTAWYQNDPVTKIR